MGGGLLVLSMGSAVGQEVVLRATAGSGFSDGYGTGLGASAGIEFPFLRDRTWFVGGRFMHHGGGDAELPESLGGPDTPGTVSQVHYGLEFGATWISSPVILRTSGGIGIARLTGETTDGTKTSSNELLLGPGFILAVPMADDAAFLGIELKWHRVQNYDSSLALYGTLGLKL